MDADKKELLFGAFLKEHRLKQKMSQRALAEMMGVTRNTVINWEADKSRPDYDSLPELCNILDIRLHELFNMEADVNFTDLERRVIGNLRELNETSQKVVDKMIDTMVEEECIARDRKLKRTYALFLVRHGSCVSGSGNKAPKYVFLRKNHINAKADGIVLVDGDSMEPVYHSGDYVYYRDVGSARPGEDVIVDTDDGAVIKRVDDDYTLYSVNPDIPYPEKSDQNFVKIRGRVLGVVASSDRPDDDEVEYLDELFKDEVRDFYEAYGVTF